MSHGLHAATLTAHRQRARAVRSEVEARDLRDGAEMWESGYSDLLCIVLDLKSVDPIATCTTYNDGTVWCHFCEAEPPGGANTLAPSQHTPACVWRQAQDIDG